MIDKRASQVQYHCRICRINKHSYSHQAIPSCETARTLSFIYDRFNGNSLADMLEKSMSDWIRSGKPGRNNKYYHYSAFLKTLLDLLQAWSHSRNVNFPQTFACLLIVYKFFIFGSLLSLLRTGPRTFPWSRFIHT